LHYGILNQQFLSKRKLISDMKHLDLYCTNVHTVTYRPIARQRLCTYIPAGANAHNNKPSTARQRISKHA
jgi:hypothetical protein